MVDTAPSYKNVNFLKQSITGSSVLKKTMRIMDRFRVRWIFAKELIVAFLCIQSMATSHSE
jgi:hypothetical protein